MCHLGVEVLDLESLLFEKKYHVRETALSLQPLNQVVEVLEVCYDGLLQLLGLY